MCCIYLFDTPLKDLFKYRRESTAVHPLAIVEDWEAIQRKGQEEAMDSEALGLEPLEPNPAEEMSRV